MLHFLRFALLLTAPAAALLSFQGGPAPFARTPSGIEYRIYHPKPGGGYTLRTDVVPAGDPTYSARIGQLIVMHMQYRTAKDSLLFNSRKQQMGVPMRVPLDELRTKGGLEEAVALLQPGDSAVFRFNVDSIFSKSYRQPVPPFLRKAGNTLLVLAKVEKVQTREQAMEDSQLDMARMKQKQDAEAAKLLPAQAATIQAYAKKNKLTLLKTTGGTYYTITRTGTGPKPKTGQIVSVLYKGSLLDGKVFDSSEKAGNKPIDFPIGTGQVIPGWDQAIAMLPKGSKAVLLIPSPLAYGSRGAGPDIPANAILRFDVELVGVK